MRLLTSSAREPPIYTLGSSSALVSRSAQIRPFCTAQPQRVHHREASAYSADLISYQNDGKGPTVITGKAERV
jgi:hypothetical protein